MKEHELENEWTQSVMEKHLNSIRSACQKEVDEVKKEMEKCRLDAENRVKKTFADNELLKEAYARIKEIVGTVEEHVEPRRDNNRRYSTPTAGYGSWNRSNNNANKRRKY